MNETSQHIVLLGDSIFDNALYVSHGPSVIDQLRELLPDIWRSTLLALDGAMAEDVIRQLRGLPADATHLVISAGGNNALAASQILMDVNRTAAAAMQHLAHVQEEFRAEFRAMLAAAQATGRRLACCTVYDACPGLPPAAITGLSLFNDVILRESFQRGLPVLDLRLVCAVPEDYSELSPIEPSVPGGAKIVRALCSMLRTHEFSNPASVIYGAA